MYRYPAGWTCHSYNGLEEIATTDEALVAQKFREGWIVIPIRSQEGTGPNTMSTYHGSEPKT